MHDESACGGGTSEKSAAIPESLAIAGGYLSESALMERGLVVLAMGNSYWIMHSDLDAKWYLAVEAHQLPDIQEQLSRYEREQTILKQTPPPTIPKSVRVRWGAALLWGCVTLVIYRAQLALPGRLESLGALDARAIFTGGEWWRAFSALFLHADAGHLIANLASGVALFGIVDAEFGRGRGWLLLAVASIWGNLAIAALHAIGADHYRSLGASTAVFAGLGLLVGRSSRLTLPSGITRPLRWTSPVVPIAAGLALLALFGGGKAPTDVGAHMTGMAAGVALGFVFATKRQTN